MNTDLNIQHRIREIKSSIEFWIERINSKTVHVTGEGELTAAELEAFVQAAFFGAPTPAFLCFEGMNRFEFRNKKFMSLLAAISDMEFADGVHRNRIMRYVPTVFMVQHDTQLPQETQEQLSKLFI